MIRGAKTTAPPAGLELVASLRALGVTLNDALLVVYLSGVEVATSKEIEAGTGLRQPEVTMGMKMLREEEIKSEKTGVERIGTLPLAQMRLQRWLANPM